MKNFTSLISPIACVCALAMFGVGCGGQVEESLKTETTTPATVGILTFETKDPATGIVRGTYEYQGHSITFEAIRGEKNPDLSKLMYGHSPEYAVDARLCSEKGFCFSQGAGGHAIADSTWIQETTENPTEEEAVIYNAVANMFHKDIGRFISGNEDEGLIDEFMKLQSISDMTLPDIPELQTPPQRQSNGTPCKGVLAINQSTPYRHVFEIWWGLAVRIAEHSSTRSLSISSTGVIINKMDTANHGSSPGDPGMNRSCGRVFPNRPIALPVTKDCTRSPTFGVAHTSAEINCCQSAYGIKSGTHVCNDDSRLQREIMIANANVANPSYCSDWSPQGWAPSCT
ncbi:MAG: hypothetical protein KIH65_004395 [Candidatus Uhrbacteria bacterium]|nr:hypothetical protein [Candidatus Uhrbacteria bacterium]